MVTGKDLAAKTARGVGAPRRHCLYAGLIVTPSQGDNPAVQGGCGSVR
jgi:hypothetical protein